ncbi:hypothetical protein [Priestia megaterium]|uniref:hypothetical protein n=1 Tax=Priestia megaterium TaxID=1404 RepID=UPI0032D92402
MAILDTGLIDVIGMEAYIAILRLFILKECKQNGFTQKQTQNAINVQVKPFNTQDMSYEISLSWVKKHWND